MTGKKEQLGCAFLCCLLSAVPCHQSVARSIFGRMKREEKREVELVQIFRNG